MKGISIKSGVPLMHEKLSRQYYSIILLFFFCIQIQLPAAEDVNRSQESVNYNYQSVADIVTANLTCQDKINRIMQILSKETCEKSLKGLSDMELYVWPGEFWESSPFNSALPLDKSIDQSDIVPILANRRFLKVMNELSLLPKEKAADILSRRSDLPWKNTGDYLSYT